MKWLRKHRDDRSESAAASEAGVRGRAAVAPASTRKRRDTWDDNTDTGSFSADEKLWVETMLTPVSAEDGLPVPAGLQQVKLNMPNWMVSVLYSAGTNEPLAAELPASVEVPVRYDPSTRAITAIDVAATAQELAPYREAAVNQFKRTDSWLAPFHVARSLPVDAGKGAAQSWKDAVGAMASEAKQPAGQATASTWSPEEVEAMRRNASILALRWQKKPKERDKARARALQALPLNLESVRAGSLSVADNLAIHLRTPAQRREAMERFPILGERRNQTAGLLSGGEQQLLSLAGALVDPPKVFVADEPSLGLAPMAVENVLSALAELRDLGCALVLIEEQAGGALALADTVVVMDLGRVAWVGPANEVDRERLGATYLGTAR